MRIKTITATCALASLGLASAALADHKPGHSPGQGASDVTISATSPIVWGRSTVITGAVRGAGAGVLVDLQSDAFPYADNEFVKDATVPTDAKGNYRFAPLPKLNTRYRVVAATSPPVTSTAATVLVQIRVKVAVSDSTPRRGSLVTFSGTACPQHDGNLVYIQRRTSTGSYGTVARTVLRDAGDTCSTYSRRIRVYSDGVYRVKVSSGGDGDHMTGVSRAVRLDSHR
ncbi:MAG TPA: hypothetical protein VF517_10135 [Thermoleophilaceae bacterium]|jgi:hypothetical protein